jgi:hypothetical protein
VSDGDTKFIASVLRLLFGGSSLPTFIMRGELKSGPTARVERTKADPRKLSAIDLSRAKHIKAQPLNWPGFQAFVATADARQDSKVLATVRRRVELAGAPRGVPARGGTQLILSLPRPDAPPGPTGPPDQGRLDLGGELDIEGVPLPRGAGRAIRPPQIAIPAARLAAGSGPRGGSEAPLARLVEETIRDVAVGGGRFLLLTLREGNRLAVFDVNQANFTKVIPLPSPNALVAAGASKFVIGFPDERRLERWDLARLERELDARPLMDGRLRGLALGSDSDCPALAFWSAEAHGANPSAKARFSFIDPDSLTVQKIGSVDLGPSARVRASDKLSTSGGSLMVDDYLRVNRGERLHLRASAGGGLYGLWEQPARFYTLMVRGDALRVTYENESLGHLAPGPDGQMMFTGAGYRHHADETIERGALSTPDSVPEPTITSSDPSYYVSIGGLPRDVVGTVGLGDLRRPVSRPGAVTASVHAAGDGTRLLTVHGLDEMAVEAKGEDWFHDGLTLDKRFHLVPTAHLLITIPPENDRLVLRRLDVEQALDQAGREEIFVTSPLALTATAGQPLEHRIEARSRKGGITCTLARGPDGMSVTPDGKITWPVPTELKGQEVTAVITVVDASGEERFRTLRIAVR